MTKEKKIAYFTVFLGFLIPLIYVLVPVVHMIGSGDISEGLRLEFIFMNLLYFWGCFFIATVLYAFVRASAVTGAALATLSLFIFFAIPTGDAKGDGAMWMVYLVWCIAAGFVSIFPALLKPQFMQKSWLRATICSALLTYSSFIVGLVGFKLFDQ
ncbi:hypothetical protein HYE66_02160 [Aggregatibacter actinomycetemcomitans]|nr:hypothetical protein [Aggregatibacter actinomycetemcomitans]